MLEQPVPEGLHPVEGAHAGAVCEELHPVGRTHAGAVGEGLQPVGRTHVGEVCGELSPVRGTFMLEEGKSVRSPLPEGQGVAETTYDELIVTTIPHPPAPLRGRRERNGIEVESGKKGEVGGRCFEIWIYFLTILL